MDDELLWSELAELKALLGDDYETLDHGKEHQENSPPERSPRRASKRQARRKTAVEEEAVEPPQPRAPLLERISVAQQHNEALTSVLRAYLAQVERQLLDSDHAATTIKQAQAIDRNLCRHAGGTQQFSWSVRHSEAARGCGRLLAATGAPAPPQSTFWAHSGKAPTPNEDSKALAKLFWHNPAASRPPRAWKRLEEDALLTAVRSIATNHKRTVLVEKFKAEVSAGADPANLKSELAAQLEALATPPGAEDVGAAGSNSSQAALPDASQFSMMDWQSVAQQIGDRKADECAVHFLSHMQKSPAREGQGDLSPDEQKALLEAVAVHGRRSWPQVAAACGLQWQPWCLLQAFWASAAAADAAADAAHSAAQAAEQAAAKHAKATAKGSQGPANSGQAAVNNGQAAASRRPLWASSGCHSGIPAAPQAHEQCAATTCAAAELLPASHCEAGAEEEARGSGDADKRTPRPSSGCQAVRGGEGGAGENRALNGTLHCTHSRTEDSVAAESCLQMCNTGLQAQGLAQQGSTGGGVQGTGCAQELPNATMERARHWSWPEDLDEKLLKHVAFMVRGGATADQCKLRFWQLQHQQRLAGAFTEQESCKVVAAVREHGEDWQKVSRVVEGRTPRQCSEHYVSASSLPSRAIAHLWPQQLRMEFFRMRVKHSRGARQVNWQGVAADLLLHCGTRFSVVDLRKKSKALVKRLTAHGMPSGYSIAQQLEYAQLYPQALETKEDRFRAQLHAWGMQKGIRIHSEAAPAPVLTSQTAVPCGSDARLRGAEWEHAAARPSMHEGHASMCPQQRVSTPKACSYTDRLRQLLQQSKYLRFLDEVHTADAGEEVAGGAPDADGVPSEVTSDQGWGKDGPHGPGCPQDRAAQVLKGVDATKHPVAAAVRAFLQGAQRQAAVPAAQTQAAAAPDAADEGAAPPTTMHAPSPAIPAAPGTPAVPPPPGTPALQPLQACVGGVPVGSSFTPRACPQAASPRGGLPGSPPCASSLPVPVSQCGAGGAARDTSISSLSTDREGTGGVEGILAGIHQGHLAGMLGEGRWIQDVKVNPEKRKARIVLLRERKRLRVHEHIAQVRDREKQAQPQDGSGCGGSAGAARSRRTRTRRARNSNADAPPPELEAASAGEAEAGLPEAPVAALQAATASAQAQAQDQLLAAQAQVQAQLQALAAQPQA